MLDAHLLACPPRLRQGLVDAGFSSVHEVCHLSAMELSREIRSSPEEAQYVIDVAKAKALGASSNLGTPVTFRTALSLFENPGEKIPLGIPRLDEALGGGVRSGQVTEICGPPGAGKTQISMLLAAMALKSDPNCSVLYIDTEGSFVPERVEDIAAKVAAPECLPNQVLSQIQCVRVHTHVEQLAVLNDLADHLDMHRNIRLVILDSIAFHMRQDTQDLNKKQHALAKTFHLLTKLAHEKKCSVWVTNHITVRKTATGNASPNSRASDAKLVPALGDLWAHVPAERFFVYNSDDFRGLLLHKSPSSPQMLFDLNKELPVLFSSSDEKNDVGDDALAAEAN